ncbi:MAG: GNAT family N-acetyltransferase [Saprospiraceae bacterium]
MMPQIIKVGKDDKKLISSIVEHFIETSDKQATSNHITKFLTDDRTHLFSAIQNDLVVGYAIVYQFPSMHDSGDLAYLYDIEVMKSQRRQGIGRQLMDVLLAHLKTIGIIELWLGTATDNIAGQALFGSTGGIKSGETFNDFTYELSPLA